MQSASRLVFVLVFLLLQAGGVCSYCAGEVVEEVVAEGAGYAGEQEDVDVVFFEDFVGVGAGAAYFAGEPGYAALLPAYHCSYCFLHGRRAGNSLPICRCGMRKVWGRLFALSGDRLLASPQRLIKQQPHTDALYITLSWGRYKATNVVLFACILISVGNFARICHRR